MGFHHQINWLSYLSKVGFVKILGFLKPKFVAFEPKTCLQKQSLKHKSSKLPTIKRLDSKLQVPLKLLNRVQNSQKTKSILNILSHQVLSTAELLNILTNP